MRFGYWGGLNDAPVIGAGDSAILVAAQQQADAIAARAQLLAQQNKDLLTPTNLAIAGGALAAVYLLRKPIKWALVLGAGYLIYRRVA